MYFVSRHPRFWNSFHFPARWKIPSEPSLLTLGGGTIYFLLLIQAYWMWIPSFKTIGHFFSLWKCVGHVQKRIGNAIITLNKAGEKSTDWWQKWHFGGKNNKKKLLQKICREWYVPAGQCSTTQSTDILCLFYDSSVGITGVWDECLWC